MNEHLKGGLLIIASMIIFAFIGPFVRWINRPSPVLLFYGGLIGALFLFVYIATKKGIREMWPKKGKWLLLAGSVLGALNVGSYFQAYRLTTMANTVLLHYTAPIFAAIFAPVFLKEKIDKVTITALALSSAGLVLIFLKNGFSLNNMATIGALFALGSGLFYGISIIVNKKLSMTFNPLLILLYQYAIFFVWVPFMKSSYYVVSSKQVILILIYMAFISILPSFLYLKGLKNVKAQHAGIIAYTETIFVIIYGYFIFNEVPSWLTLFGGALIVASGIMVLRAEAKRG